MAFFSGEWHFQGSQGMFQNLYKREEMVYQSWESALAKQIFQGILFGLLFFILFGYSVLFGRIWREETCEGLKLNIQKTHLTINSLGIQILYKNNSRQGVSIVCGRGGYNSKIFLSSRPDSFLISLLKVKEVCPFQTEVVNMWAPSGSLGRHSNQVQHNLLSYSRLAMSDFTVMKSKNLTTEGTATWNRVEGKTCC